MAKFPFNHCFWMRRTTYDLLVCIKLVKQSLFQKIIKNVKGTHLLKAQVKYLSKNINFSFGNKLSVKPIFTVALMLIFAEEYKTNSDQTVQKL